MATPARPVLAITTGEPAGIGPEISIRAAWALRDVANCVLLGDAAFLALTASLIDPSIRLAALSTMALRNAGLPQFGRGPDGTQPIAVIDVPLAAHVVPGTLDAANGRAVLATLDLALEGVQAGWFDAIVTAPLQKSTINDAGIPFSGHTEYLAAKTSTPQVVMMLAGPTASAPGGPRSRELRVALATTHLPLKDVPAAITQEGLARVIDIIDADLKAKFGIRAPRILVTGLNPHAGEHGYLGREEIDVIEQGLPVLKHATFGHGVNITLGLPLIRTSVDHGTALDLAAEGLGRADVGSMEEAIRVALHMVGAQRGRPL
jgi:4-hydroxythreonine-4-phosphate dehydrogenase